MMACPVLREYKIVFTQNKEKIAIIDIIDCE